MSLDESKLILNQLNTNLPNIEMLSQLDDQILKPWLVKVLKTKIGETRNKVVHKYGYRPSLIVVEGVIQETQDIIDGLRFSLGILTDHHYFYWKK